ncbi:MAG TPA: ABC transporter substrate-binding protein, partial [Chloroflexota bacterium]|nr:ABC transporter substrate-binding protein [Chloroflexota bacterium]
EHPWLAFNLYSAFVKSKEASYAKLSESIPSGLIFGPEYLAQTRKIFGSDPFPYGVKANRPMLETIIDYSHEQGLTPEKLKIEDLFAPSTLDL